MLNVAKATLTLFTVILAYLNGFSQCVGPTVSSFPYDENFESAPAWTVSGTNSDWAWGTPAGSFINTAGGGQKSWVAGGLNGNGYNLSEQAYLLSPCFNFSSVVNPWIQFKIFWECEYHYDGMVLQSTVDNGATWVNVGAYGDQVNCLNQNWYNYANINWLTSIPVKHGWSGRTEPTVGNCQGGNGSMGWVVASHCLDGLAGEPQVQFRFLFGSGTTCNGYDGVALDDIHIGEAPVLNPTITSNCVNASTVSFNVNSNGCPPNATWNFGDGSASVNSSPGTAVNHTYTAPGIYNVTATVGGLCYANASISTSVTILQVQPTAVSPSCFNDANGSLTLSVLPASAQNVTYAWASGGSGNALQNIGAGTYSVVINATDACTLNYSTTLSNPAQIQVTASSTNAACGMSNGTANCNVQNAQGQLTYLWNNLSSTQQISNLSSGNYSVNVTDGNGCTASASTTVGETALPPLTIQSIQQITCNGANNGSVVVGASGMENLLNWVWTPNVSSTNTASNLAPGTYNVSAGLSANCSSSVSFTIVEPSPLNLFLTAVDPVVIQGNLASINTSVTGGTAPYAYNWNSGWNFSETFDYQIDQTTFFDVVVTDANGCTAEDTLTIQMITPVSNEVFLYIPNCITPNGDGINDVFVPIYSNLKSPTMKIFNRWGDVIFESKNEHDFWYGQVHDGEYYAQDGAYTYLFSALNNYQENIYRTGHVVIIR